MYRQLYNSYRKKYRGPIKKELDKQCLEILNGEEPDKEGLKKIIRKLHQGAGVTMAKYSYDSLMKQVNVKNSLSPQQKWAVVIKNLLDLGLDKDMEGITTTSKENMRKILTKGMQEGWSIPQMMKELEKSGINAYRAELIARTETTRAANSGSLLGAVSTGLKANKEWIAATDKRTRRLPQDSWDHLHMNGAVVYIDQDFVVPGKGQTINMAHPGDPRGGPGNVCNCRCSIGFIVIRDKKGKPIEQTDKLEGVAGVMWELWNNELFLRIQRLINEAISM